jgi:hypothetical protein
MRIWLFAVALLLAACVTSTQIVGPYASRLSDRDIQQIKLLVSGRPDIDHGIRKLEVVRPDRVRVEAGHIDSLGGWRGTNFLVLKRNGQWLFDERSGLEATNERTIISD